MKNSSRLATTAGGSAAGEGSVQGSWTESGVQIVSRTTRTTGTSDRPGIGEPASASGPGEAETVVRPPACTWRQPATRFAGQEQLSSALPAEGTRSPAAPVSPAGLAAGDGCQPTTGSKSRQSRPPAAAGHRVGPYRSSTSSMWSHELRRSPWGCGTPASARLEGVFSGAAAPRGIGRAPTGWNSTDLARQKAQGPVVSNFRRTETGQRTDEVGFAPGRLASGTDGLEAGQHLPEARLFGEAPLDPKHRAPASRAWGWGRWLIRLEQNPGPTDPELCLSPHQPDAGAGSAVPPSTGTAYFSLPYHRLPSTLSRVRVALLLNLSRSINIKFGLLGLTTVLNNLL